MKEGIHPEYFQASVVCIGCNATFTTGATVKELRINVCSLCHPFYSGTQKILDAEGRVDRFKRKYAKFNEGDTAAKAS